MLLGIAHLSFNTNNILDVEHKLISADYHRVFEERGLSNDLHKQNLLQTYIPFHDLVLFQSLGKIPIEITYHGEISGDAERYEIDENIIVMNTNKMVDDIAFFNSFGFEVQQNNLYFKSLLPGRNINIRLVYKKNLKESYLDNYGYTCLAMAVRNIDLYAKKLNTESFEVVVNNHGLNVIMVRTPSGGIVELIEPIAK